MNKLLLISFLLTIIIACAEKDHSKDGTDATVDGAVIYKKYCILCHGADGKLGLNGSKDITASTLTKEERMVLITNGKNTMTPFGGILSKEEIEAVAEYTFTLKSK
jgi:cytochrome c6